MRTMRTLAFLIPLLLAPTSAASPEPRAPDREVQAPDVHQVSQDVERPAVTAADSVRLAELAYGGAMAKTSTVTRKGQVAFVGRQELGAQGERDAVVLQILLRPEDASDLKPGDWISLQSATAPAESLEYFPLKPGATSTE